MINGTPIRAARQPSTKTPRIFATVGLGLAIAGAAGTALVRHVWPAPFIAVNAELRVAGFAARLRDEVDIATVTTDLHWTVQGAVNPPSLGLWIREARP